jgi:uncharacterized membrane protein
MERFVHHHLFDWLHHHGDWLWSSKAKHGSFVATQYALIYIALGLNLIAFIFLAGSSPSNNAIRLKLKHPMILGVKVWALAHLLSNGTLVNLILFGAFLIWAVLDFRSARKRPILIPEKAIVSTKATVITIASGIILWIIFIFGLHQYLIGVSPLAQLS